jgi:hypothetical protein
VTKKSKIIWASLTAIVLVVTSMIVLAAIYKNETTKKEKARITEEQQIIDKISKLLRLPNELPIVTTVYNEKDFENDSIFRVVKTGDKILLFINAKQSVVYRPSTNQVIEVLPVKSELKTNN